MKYCVHCGKELLDEAVACPYCGAATGDGNKGKRSKRVVITLVILLAAFIMVAGAFLIGGEKLRLNEEETYALMAAQQIQERLLVPDSIYIYDLYVNLYDEEEENDSILGETLGGAFVHYSAENRVGGTTENKVVVYFNPEGMSILSEEDLVEALQMENDGGLSDGLIEALAGNIYRRSVERFRDNGTKIDPQRIVSALDG